MELNRPPRRSTYPGLGLWIAVCSYACSDVMIPAESRRRRPLWKDLDSTSQPQTTCQTTCQTTRLWTGKLLQHHDRPPFAMGVWAGGCRLLGLSQPDPGVLQRLLTQCVSRTARIESVSTPHGQVVSMPGTRPTPLPESSRSPYHQCNVLSTLIACQ